MITGAHSIIYSKNAEADKKFFRDVLKFNNVDVGGGWLIFGLPPAEIAVHPHSKNDLHEFYLMYDDIKAFITEMKKKKVMCSELHHERWGILSQISLPGGGKLGVYQPLHPSPKPIRVKAASKKVPKAKTKKSDSKTAKRKAKK